MSKLTREQILDLRKSFEVWQQDYDPLRDKEQHDMFALGVMAMDEMLATMDSEAARRREWMARGVEAMGDYYGHPGGEYVQREANRFSAKIRAGEVE